VTAPVPRYEHQQTVSWDARRSEPNCRSRVDLAQYREIEQHQIEAEAAGTYRVESTGQNRTMEDLLAKGLAGIRRSLAGASDVEDQIASSCWAPAGSDQPSASKGAVGDPSATTRSAP
jgi:hypothetical protein